MESPQADTAWRPGDRHPLETPFSPPGPPEVIPEKPELFKLILFPGPFSTPSLSLPHTQTRSVLSLKTRPLSPQGGGCTVLGFALSAVLGSRGRAGLAHALSSWRSCHGKARTCLTAASCHLATPGWKAASCDLGRPGGPGKLDPGQVTGGGEAFQPWTPPPPVCALTVGRQERSHNPTDRPLQRPSPAFCAWTPSGPRNLGGSLKSFSGTALLCKN